MNFDDIFNFLVHGHYPNALSKDQKRSFRRKATENYKVEKGVLYYAKKATGPSDRLWRIVITTNDEQRKIINGNMRSDGFWT